MKNISMGQEKRFLGNNIFSMIRIVVCSFNWITFQYLYIFICIVFNGVITREIQEN